MFSAKNVFLRHQKCKVNIFPLFIHLFWLHTIKMKFIKGKLPLVHIIAPLPSAPQKLRKWVLKASFSSVPGKGKPGPLDLQNSVFWNIRNSPQSVPVTQGLPSANHPPGRAGQRGFCPQELTRIGLKSSLRKKSLYFNLHYKLLEKTDGGDDRKSNYFSWASFLSGF